MKIGILKEIKKEEYRVALVPQDVQELVKQGHDVFFEIDCGIEAGFPNADYIAIGAKEVNKKEVFKESDIIVKVKTPMADEPAQFKKGQTLFSYLHYDGNETLEGAEYLRKNKVTAIALEWVEENGSNYPLLRPMSEITGIVGANKIIELFRRKSKRIFGNYSKEISPATVMLFGIGIIGANALNVFMHHEANLIIFDKHPETLTTRVKKYINPQLWENYQKSGKVKVILSKENNIVETQANIIKYLPEIDILFFSAIRRPGFKAAHLIDKQMLSYMKKGAFVMDAAANDKDLIETIESYPELDKVYKIDGIWHYANDHIPSMAAHDASTILSNSILPYLLELVNKGTKKAIFENEAIAKGTIIAGKKYTHKYTCNRKGLTYTTIYTALAEESS